MCYAIAIWWVLLQGRVFIACRADAEAQPVKSLKVTFVMPSSTVKLGGNLRLLRGKPLTLLPSTFPSLNLNNLTINNLIRNSILLLPESSKEASSAPFRTSGRRTAHQTTMCVTPCFFIITKVGKVQHRRRTSRYVGGTCP
jgi:hypothetical protein